MNANELCTTFIRKCVCVPVCHCDEGRYSCVARVVALKLPLGPPPCRRREAGFGPPLLPAALGR